MYKPQVHRNILIRPILIKYICTQFSYFLSLPHIMVNPK